MTTRFAQLILVVTLFVPLTLTAADPAPSAPPGIAVQPDSPWLSSQNRPILLVGDSITQGWMELGTNFDQTAYLDALAQRGINATLLWSYIGITDQPHDPRIGYDAPEIWPWNRRNNHFDLDSFNPVYFQRLRAFLDLARARNIIVIITVHDGWTKTRFPGHPFNLTNGGALKNRSDYVRLGRPGSDMPLTTDPNWSPAEKHQYALERFCDKLLSTTGDAPNVIYELFNEGEWYRRHDWEQFQRHFARFFHHRTRQPVMVNDDQKQGRAFRAEKDVNLLSFHAPQWEKQPPARTFFDLYAAQRTATPLKPVLFTEPVPEYQGGTERDAAIVRLLWGTVLGGSGILFQNDTSWGFDPRTTMARHIADRDRILDYEGHLARFINSGKVDLHKLQPAGSLVSSGVCLADAPAEYLAFFDRVKADSTLDLTAAQGKAYTTTWFDPRTGKSQAGEKLTGGGIAPLQIPFPHEAVLHLRQAK